MKRSLFRFFFFLALFCACPQANAQSAFIENKGQIVDQNGGLNPDVLFLYNGPGFKMQLRRSGYSYEIVAAKHVQFLQGNKSSCSHEKLQEQALQVSRVDLDLLDLDSSVEIIPAGANADRLNYFLNGKEITQVQHFNKVTYKNAYAHTDIEFLITGDAAQPVKYNIILRPGADLSRVRYLVKGAEAIELDGTSLDLRTAYGTFHEAIPFSYYTDSPKDNKPVSFALQGDILSFKADVDPRRTLVIDPAPALIWSTYYGGPLADLCSGVGTDQQNNVYMSGRCNSASNVATSGSYQSVLAGNFDVYLVKFDYNGVRQWATYFGGSSSDVAYAMCVQPDGLVYLSGDSFSTSGVASSGAQQQVYGGGVDDAFLAKFDGSGQRIWSTYYGGTEHDIAQAVTVDNAGNVVIAGHTESNNGISTAGAYKTIYSFNYDVFVAKFSPAGALLWGSYYGDTSVDEAYGAACDNSGNVYVVGRTDSNTGISTLGCHQPNFGGLQDAFIVKFYANGSGIVWGTYYGGQSADQATVVRVAGSGNVLAGGYTGSTANIAGPGAYQAVPGSADDAFLLCLSSTGQRQWGTYYGGNDSDYLTDLTFDGNNILICGTTLSTNSMTTANAYQTLIGGVNTYDAYYAEFSGSGQRSYSTYFGGTANDDAVAIAMDNTGKIYMAGTAGSSLGLSTPGSHQPAYGGGSTDAFLAKFCPSVQSCLTGVDDVELGPGRLIIYPNPVEDRLNVCLPGKAQGNIEAEAYSSFGQLMAVPYNMQGDCITFSAGDLPAGVYVLNIRQGAVLWKGKFVVTGR